MNSLDHTELLFQMYWHIYL